LGAFEAVQTFGQAGEKADQLAQGLPGHFITLLLDQLYLAAQAAKGEA
jgi:hydroxyethylthiazole kinase-like sugar kinase family protein